MVFKENQEDKGKEKLKEDEIALITRSMMDSFRKFRNNRRGENFGMGKYINDQSRNHVICQKYEKYGHKASECPQKKITPK